MSELAPGESLDMGTCTDGGPVVYRDTMATDTFSISQHGGELSREEIRTLAEAAGLEVAADE